MNAIKLDQTSNRQKINMGKYIFLEPDQAEALSAHSQTHTLFPPLRVLQILPCRTPTEYSADVGVSDLTAATMLDYLQDKPRGNGWIGKVDKQGTGGSKSQ